MSLLCLHRAHPDPDAPSLSDLPKAGVEEQASTQGSYHSAAVSAGVFLVVALAVVAFTLRAPTLPVAGLRVLPCDDTGRMLTAAPRRRLCRLRGPRENGRNTSPGLGARQHLSSVHSGPGTWGGGEGVRGLRSGCTKSRAGFPETTRPVLRRSVRPAGARTPPCARRQGQQSFLQIGFFF